MKVTQFSRQYPPKNRPTETDLSFLDIEITSSDGRSVYDPNTAAMTAASGKLLFGEPLPEILSDISGKSAYKFRTMEVEMALTPDELLRLWRRDLRPEEFFKLRDKFGVFFEIHDDFYDEEDGYAIQPME
jgi:hypothetical protein